MVIILRKQWCQDWAKTTKCKTVYLHKIIHFHNVINIDLWHLSSSYCILYNIRIFKRLSTFSRSVPLEYGAREVTNLKVWGFVQTFSEKVKSANTSISLDITVILIYDIQEVSKSVIPTPIRQKFSGLNCINTIEKEKICMKYTIMRWNNTYFMYLPWQHLVIHKQFSLFANYCDLHV